VLLKLGGPFGKWRPWALQGRAFGDNPPRQSERIAAFVAAHYNRDLPSICSPGGLQCFREHFSARQERPANYGILVERQKMLQARRVPIQRGRAGPRAVQRHPPPPPVPIGLGEVVDMLRRYGG